MPTQRIYIIGAGIIAGTHIEAAKRLPNADSIEIHVSDIDKACIESIGARLPHLKTHTDTTAMLAVPARPDDIVIVSTHPNSHCALTLQALETGRHVLCEKPLAMNRQEGLTMLAKARKTGKLLGCCSSRFIGHFATETMKTLLDEAKLGELYHVRWCYRGQSSRTAITIPPNRAWSFDAKRAGGGVVMDWGPYDFTTLSDVLRPVKVEVVSAWMAPEESTLELPGGGVLDVEFHAGAEMIYHREDGSRVHVSYERGHPTYSEGCSIFDFEGTRGAVRLDWLSEQGLQHSFDRDGKVATEHVPYEQPEDALKMLERPLCYFYDSVNGQPSHAVVNEQAVFNFHCIRAICDCAETGQPQTVTKENLQ